MVGGAPTAATDFGRSVVMILGSSGTACTATAIGLDLLLTAAHCVQPGSDYKLVGSEPGQPFSRPLPASSVIRNSICSAYSAISRPQMSR
ncbi:MAG: trypsin-like serine protease [Xanthobacteraceae bacterium]